MTEADVISHWGKGARDALDVAKLACEHGKYELALYHCHLTAEKAFEAAVMEKTGKLHPKIHGLARLASLVGKAARRGAGALRCPLGLRRRRPVRRSRVGGVVRDG